VPGLLQVRLVGAGKPVLTQTRVDRFLSSPQRADVGMIGGEARSHLGTLGNGAVAGDQDINVPGGLTQPVECRLVGAHLALAARVQERDQDVGPMSPASRTPRSARRTAAWPMACA
jgi:hypothetical protein